MSRYKKFMGALVFMVVTSLSIVLYTHYNHFNGRSGTDRIADYLVIILFALAELGIGWWLIRWKLFKEMKAHMEEHVGEFIHVYDKARRYKIHKEIPMTEFYRKSKSLAYELHGIKYNAAQAERYSRAVLCFIFLSKYKFDWGKIRRHPMYHECKKHYGEIKLFDHLLDKLYEERYGGY